MRMLDPLPPLARLPQPIPERQLFNFPLLETYDVSLAF